MTYAESYIQINNTWHLLLIVKTSEPTAFGSLISFESGDYTCHLQCEYANENVRRRW